MSENETAGSRRTAGGLHAEEGRRKTVSENETADSGQTAGGLRAEKGRRVSENETADSGQTPWILPTDRLVRLAIRGRLDGEAPDRLAFWFHLLLAEQIVEGCRRAAKETGLRICALSGGVFQNLLLLRLCDDGLSEEGFQVLRHRLLPPNDGGIALGQAFAAMSRIQKEK